MFFSYMNTIMYRSRWHRHCCLTAVVISIALCAGCTGQSNDAVETRVAPVIQCDDAGRVGLDISAKLQDETVFRQDEILEYHISIDDETLADLEQTGNDEAYRPASLRVIGQCIDETFEQVGYRYKGAATLARCWSEETGERITDFPCGKISGKLRFNKYDEDARLFGLKRLNLNAMVDDNTRLHEKLSYRIFNDFGVVAPRTAHARLYINGALKGLFLAVEAVDGRFTKFRFPAGGDGNLYKEIWPSANFTRDAILRHLKTNDDAGEFSDVSDFVRFQDAVAGATVADFVESVGGVLNLDAMMRYMAVDRAVRNWDGVTAFYSPYSPHNFYWYHDAQNTNQFYLVPWDVDRTFNTADLYMAPRPPCDEAPVPNWNAAPANCDPRLTCNNAISITPSRCDHFMNMLALTLWPEFEALGHRLLEKVVTEERLNRLITLWSSQIADSVAEDPYMDSAHWEKSVGKLRLAVRDTIADFNFLLQEGLVEESAGN